MDRKQFIRNTSLLTGSIWMQNRSLSQLFSKPDYSIKMLRNNVGIFTERGGTIGFLLSKDGIVVIDDQFRDTARHLIAVLQMRDALPINYLLYTLNHGE